MPDRLLAPASMAALLCLTTTAVVAQAPGTMNADQGWSSIKRCAQEDTERARHSCLDRVLREAGLLTDEMYARQQRNAFGLENKPERTVTPPAPATVAPPAAAASTASRASTASAPATTSGAPAPAHTAAAPPPAKAAPPPPPAQPEQLEVELAKVEKAVNGRLFVTTTDGAVWLQAEAVEMPQPPVAGDR